MSEPFSAVDNFISGNDSRIFLNLELGCSSSCSYCYLPSEGMSHDERPPEKLRRSATEMLVQLENFPNFKPGATGSILSIGCFSECWDERIKSETIALINGLLPLGNHIQFATKREVLSSDIRLITRSKGWRGQVAAYISTATISQWKIYERGTAPPLNRFRSFQACRELGMRTCLYIKPVIPGVTVLDSNAYGEIMEHNKIDAIVGEHFSSNESSILSPISSRLYVTEHSDVVLLRENLSTFGKVFTKSTEHLLAKQDDVC